MIHKSPLICANTWAETGVDTCVNTWPERGVDTVLAQCWCVLKRKNGVGAEFASHRDCIYLFDSPALQPAAEHCSYECSRHRSSRSTAPRNFTDKTYDLANRGRLMLWHRMAKELKAQDIPVMAILKEFSQHGWGGRSTSTSPCSKGRV